MKQRIIGGSVRNKIGIKVGDIMTQNLVTVNPETTVRECVEKMLNHKIGSLLVTSNNALVGIITRYEIVGIIPQGKDATKVKAKDIMQKRVRTISPDVDLYEAIIHMRRTKIKKLPVMHAGKLVGILATRDILKLEPQLFEFFAESLYIKEESEKLRKRDAIMANRFYAGIERRGDTEGPCEECGNFDMLIESEGRLLCTECIDLLRE